MIPKDASANAVCDRDLDVIYGKEGVLVTFLSCVVVFPFLSTSLLLVVVKSCRTEIGERLTKTKDHANIAALALTGITLSVFVVIMDTIAMVFILANNHELSKYNIFLMYSLSFHSVTFFFDTLLTLLAVGALVYLACLDEPQDDNTGLRQRVNVLRRCFACCLCIVFPFERFDDTSADSKALEEAGNKYRMWILTFTFIAPLFCIGSHAGYIVVAWISDTTHSGSTTFIIVLSFFYYFFAFRQLYRTLANTNRDCNARECCVGICLWLRPCKWFIDCIECLLMSICICFGCICSCWCKDSSDITASDEYKVEDCSRSRSESTKRKRFKFWVLLVELCIGIVLFAIEGFVVYAFHQLPVPTNAIPSHIFNLLQLAFVVISGLAVYKILVLHMPAEVKKLPTSQLDSLS